MAREQDDCLEHVADRRLVFRREAPACVVVEQRDGNAVKRAFDGDDLCKHFEARPAILHHPCDAADLPLGAMQALHEKLSVGAVPDRRRRQAPVGIA